MGTLPMAELKGSCRCGAVQYTISADPIFTGICHCTSCRKSTGSAYSTVMGVPTAAVTVTGSTTQFDDIADSGQARHRNFCPVCGSTITQTADVMQGMTMIGVGTLDDSTAVKPAMQIYCDSALEWAKVPDMQGFPKMPG
jgi:hypothetical protein